MFDDKRRTKPLRMMLGVLADPFTRSLGDRPNERKRSLQQYPNIGVMVGAVHCLQSAFAMVALA
jgi:hypothetical protein